MTIQTVGSAASARIASAKNAIEIALGFVAQGRALDAEPDLQRRTANLALLLGTSELEASNLLFGDPTRSSADPDLRLKAEAIQGSTVDWQGIAWLDLAKTASLAVARITLNGEGFGTGFMIAPGLLMTNNHVISSIRTAQAMQAEFCYELDALDQPRQSFSYALAPEAFFITDAEDDLDYTIVAVSAPRGHAKAIDDFSYLPLSDSPAKHAIGTHVTVIQHPNGGYKLIVFRENRILHRGDNVLHYMADTEPGASGSPVLNDRFQVVALHHWGGPHREITDADGRPLQKDVNEGLRISAIVRELRARAGELSPAQQEKLFDTFDKEPPWPVTTLTQPQEGKMVFETIAVARKSAEGAEQTVRIDSRGYGSRRGYDPNFLGAQHAVELPALTASLREFVARPRGRGENTSIVLPYHHFSLVMNGARRLAFFTAVNVDGYSWRNVDRDTGLVKEAAEAREKWYTDPRIDEGDQSDDDIYLEQGKGRYFQRGHLVRRLDPTWGSGPMAEFANADTFHFTNCAPQSQGFNDAKKIWAGIEDYVLYTARALRERISIFSGPIMTDDDPEWRGIQVPLAYFKIVARVEDDYLRATAFIADQSEFVTEILKRMKEEGREASSWEDLPVALTEYRSTVKEVEDRTGLVFKDLAAADTHVGTGSENARGKSLDDLLRSARPKVKKSKEAA